MPHNNQSIEARLLAAQVAIDNALNDQDMQTYLAEYGYTTDRINEGKALYEAAQQLQQQQKTEYSEQFAATDALKTAWEKATAEYMRHVKIARIALKANRGTFQKLALDGKRKVTLSGWLGQAKQFYINALTDDTIVSQLGRFGVTAEKLQAGQQLVAEVEAANAAQACSG